MWLWFADVDACACYRLPACSIDMRGVASRPARDARRRTYERGAAASVVSEGNGSRTAGQLVVGAIAWAFAGDDGDAKPAVA